MARLLRRSNPGGGDSDPLSMPAYALFDKATVHDPQLLGRYAAGAAETGVAHGGRYLVVAPTPTVLEGVPDLAAPVLIEFPDLEAARGWYDSEEDAPWKAMRQKACDNTAVIFPGLGEGAGR